MSVIGDMICRIFSHNWVRFRHETFNSEFLYRRIDMRKLLIALIALAAIAMADEESLGNVIGIDLGTTYSCVGVYRKGQVEIIPNEQGNRITPSYVAWDDKERMIGDAAKNQATINPERTVFDVKRMIGRKFSDPEVQKVIDEVAAQLGDTGRILVRESGTEPVLRVMVEAPEQALCTALVDRVVDVICARGHARV